jgi:hypothetical protein
MRSSSYIPTPQVIASGPAIVSPPRLAGPFFVGGTLTKGKMNV